MINEIFQKKTTKAYKKPPLVREVAVRSTDGGLLKNTEKNPQSPGGDSPLE